MERHHDLSPDRKGFKALEDEKVALVEETRIVALLEDASRNASEEECAEIREAQKITPRDYKGTVGGHQIHAKWSVDPDSMAPDSPNGYGNWHFSIDGTEVLDRDYRDSRPVRDEWKNFLIKKVGLNHDLMIDPPR